MPWCHHVCAVVDTRNKKVTLIHKGKAHVLDTKLKRESILVVSASAITTVMKIHLSIYLVFAKDATSVDEQFTFSQLDKERT